MRKELGKVESSMAKLETEKTALEAAIGNTTDAARIREISQQLKTVIETLANLEIQWLTLGETLG
jgi:hypothetical protein